MLSAAKQEKLRGDVQPIDMFTIERQLRSGCKNSCRDTLCLFFADIGYNSLDSLMMRLYITMGIYVAARTFTKELGVSDERFAGRFGTIDDIEMKLTTPMSVLTYFADMLEQCVAWRIAFSREDTCGSITKAKEYINDNYSSEEMSLRSVAEAISLTPTYFSSLFKKEEGVNFIKYLTRVRIEKAKELLCRTSMQISEIAYKVGFSDYRYFGQIFKKHTGNTPREFQRINNS